MKHNYFLLGVIAICIIPVLAFNNDARQRKSTTHDVILSSEDQSGLKDEFLPLKVGNSWTYKRTIKRPENVFNYTNKTTTEASKRFPKGSTFFSAGRAFAARKLNSLVSSETYTITKKNTYQTRGITHYDFSVSVVTPNGDPARDGRYSSNLGIKTRNPNIRWKYADNGIWEIMDGYDENIKTRDQTQLVSSNVGRVIFEHNQEAGSVSWNIYADIYPDTITVPAGKFANCLANITVIGGDNIDEIVKYADPIHCVKDALSHGANPFGCFITKSYYAKGVGLVLELQLDYNNNVVYRMELQSYKVN